MYTLAILLFIAVLETARATENPSDSSTHERSLNRFENAGDAAAKLKEWMSGNFSSIQKSAETPARKQLALPKTWRSDLKEGSSTIEDLYRLLSPWGTPKVELHDDGNFTIVENIEYLMPFEVCRRKLRLEGLTTRKPIICPGWPQQTFFYYSFSGAFEDAFTRLLLIVDATDQIAAVQFVRDSPEELVRPRLVVARRNEWHTFNFVESRSRLLTSVEIDHVVRRGLLRRRQIVQIDSMASSRNPDHPRILERIRLYLPQPIVDLILESVRPAREAK
jgi:hypothetical protein